MSCTMPENMDDLSGPYDPRVEQAEHLNPILLTATHSNGGPFDTAAFFAGYAAGSIITSLTTLKAAGGTLTTATQIPRELVEQVDLIAMFFGYRALTHDADDGSPAGPFTWVKFTNDPMLKAVDD